MKDSQHGGRVGGGELKYIKVNNERFSTLACMVSRGVVSISR